VKDLLLSVRGLAKSYGRTRVLAGLDLDLGPGEMLGLVGPNGVGKTTLLRCLLGLAFPERGSVVLEGRDALADPVWTRGRVGYLPGETSLYPQMTGKEALDFGLRFHRELDEETRDLCLEVFRIPLRRKIRSYSAGMKQQLALTIALSPRVPLLVLDEPDKALDPSVRGKLRGICLDLKGKGRSILVSTHHLEELERLSDRLAFLVRGRIADPREVDEARKRLERRVRGRFSGKAPKLSTPLGCTGTIRDGEFLFETEDSEARVALIDALMEAGPESLSFGSAPLHELYDLLYAGDPEVDE